MAATVRLAGSARVRPRVPDLFTARPLTHGELAAPATVTVHLRESPRADTLAVALARQHHTPVQSRRYPSAAELIHDHRAHAADVAAVTHWANQAGLRVRRTGSGTTLDVSGSLGALARAFEVTLESCRARDTATGAITQYRDHREELSVPADLEAVVTAALGLSDRPVARPRLSVLPRGQSASYVYSPEQLARVYDFPVLPEGGAGNSITVGIAELGGAVYRPDLSALAARHPRVRITQAAQAGVRLPQIHRLPGMPGKHAELADQCVDILAVQHDQATGSGQNPIKNLGTGLRWGGGHCGSHCVPVLQRRR